MISLNINVYSPEKCGKLKKESKDHVELFHDKKISKKYKDVSKVLKATLDLKIEWMNLIFNMRSYLFYHIAFLRYTVLIF